jgi:hypothetical protein
MGTSDQSHFVQGQSVPTAQDHAGRMGQMKAVHISHFTMRGMTHGNLDTEGKCLRLFCHNAMDNGYLTRRYDQRQIGRHIFEHNPNYTYPIHIRNVYTIQIFLAE